MPVCSHCYAAEDTLLTLNENLTTFIVNFGHEAGINDYPNSNEINIFPNPTNDRLNIAIDENAQLEIINLQGQIVVTKNLTKKTNTIDVSNLPSGVYTLRIKTEKGIAIRKLMKQ